MLIDVHVLFRFKSSFLNLFLLQGFKGPQREPVPIRLVNVDMTPEQRFAGLCLDGVM